MHEHHTANLKVKKLPDSEAEITGEINLDYISKCREEALKSLNDSAKIPGFRPGKVPEEALVKTLGEMRILEETSEVALGREYPHIIEEAKVNPIGRPQISITKLAPGVPLEFKIKVTLEPEFPLPDYKKIASGVPRNIEEEPTEKEVKDLLGEIEKRKIDVELKEGETLEDKLRENLKTEKAHRSMEKRRVKIVEEIVKASLIPTPKILVEAEQEKMLRQFESDVINFGKSFPEYLKEVKKTEADLKEEWKNVAIERVKAELIIGKIAEVEKIEPKDEELEHEVKHLFEHYPDADPLRARIYVYTMMRNQKVLEFLESIDGEGK